jgi:hypothetical protein
LSCRMGWPLACRCCGVGSADLKPPFPVSIITSFKTHPPQGNPRAAREGGPLHSTPHLKLGWAGAAACSWPDGARAMLRVASFFWLFSVREPSRNKRTDARNQPRSAVKVGNHPISVQSGARIFFLFPPW